MIGVLAFVRAAGADRPLGTITFSSNDASVYMRPVGSATATYDYGFAAMNAGEAEKTFETAGQKSASDRPHISIHDSGACHVRAGVDRKALISASEIGRLSRFQGVHVGTLQTSDIMALPVLADVWPDVGARDEDAELWDVTPPAGAASVRAVVFVSRNQPRRQLDSYAIRPFKRKRADGGVLFVSVELMADEHSLGVPFVGAIGGWDPVSARVLAIPSRFVYVRDTAA